jgi:hypothetical protein
MTRAVGVWWPTRQHISNIITFSTAVRGCDQTSTPTAFPHSLYSTRSVFYIICIILGMSTTPYLTAMARTRIPAPVTGTGRIHKTNLIFTYDKITASPSPSPDRSPARNDIENIYAVTDNPSPSPSGNQLLSLKEILSAPAPTPLERAMARPYSGDFGQLVNVYNRTGGWTQRDVHKGGQSKLRVAHDAARFFAAAEEDEEDDNELWSDPLRGVEKEGMSQSCTKVLTSLAAIAALQDDPKFEKRGVKAKLRDRLGTRGAVKISRPLVDDTWLFAMDRIMGGTSEIQEMAKQARLEGRVARVEQIALRVEQLVASLHE